MPDPHPSQSQGKSPSPPADENSARAVLESLAADRGDLLSDTEYQAMRRIILEELAHRPRPRSFTLFTFAVVTSLLLGFVLLGLITLRHDRLGGMILSLTSLGALALWGGFLRSYYRGLQNELARSLRQRLEELEELRIHHLISEEEYQYIHAGILLGRQRSPSP